MSTAFDPQAPAVPARPLHDIGSLALMLAEGWQIEAPVLARLSWAQRCTGELAYHVIVRRAAQRSLIVIAEGPELQQFLAEHAIPVS